MSTDLLSADPNTSCCAADLTAHTDRGRDDRTERPSVDLSGQGREVVIGEPPVDATGSMSAVESDLSAVSSLRTLARDLVELTKPRIVVMILVTTIATALIASGGSVLLPEMILLLLGTGLIAGSAGSANQVWERDIDAHMNRTSRRPIPDGRMGVAASILWTAVCGIAGTAILWTQFSAAPALAGLATWAIYVLVYTPMKTRTAWNTTVGAIAGALPMLIGYTALGGSAWDATAWLLVGVLVAWQYPHFMAIAWMYRHQYDRAGFRMSTTVDTSGRSAGWQSVIGSLVLIGFGIALCVIPSGTVGAALGSLAVILCCLPMLRRSIAFSKNRNDANARKLLRSSLLVLPTILLVVTLRVFL